MLDFVLSDKGQAIWANAYLRPARNVPLPEDVAKAKFLPAKRLRARQERRLGQDGEPLQKALRRPLPRRSAMMQ